MGSKTPEFAGDRPVGPGQGRDGSCSRARRLGCSSVSGRAGQGREERD